MIHKTLVVGPLQCNCVILASEKTLEACIIDPGDEGSRIVREVEAAGLKVKYLLHTHAHFDHIGATAEVKARLAATTCLHRDDELLYNNLPMQGRLFGFDFQPAPLIEKFLEDGEVLEVGELRLEVIHTPGHSPGSVCLSVLGSEPKLFSGDTLFRQSVGRTDLWGGDFSKLVSSIKGRLLRLDDDIPVFPGHGPETLIGEEKRLNPFLT